MHHIPNDQVHTIIMLCQILGNQVYAIREVDIWRRALTRAIRPSLRKTRSAEHLSCPKIVVSKVYYGFTIST